MYYSVFIISTAIPYTVRVVTGRNDDEGTTANVFIVFIGTEAVSEKIPLDLIGKDGFAAKSVETFSIEAPDCGEIKKVEAGFYELLLLCVTIMARHIPLYFYSDIIEAKIFE